MTWFEDLTECTYFPVRVATLRAIGWLQRGRPFPVGEVETCVYEKIVEMCKNPWQPMVAVGFHECDLCIYQGARGVSNLFIPGDGILYVCPELVTHYMNAHGYKPPKDFCDAVMNCPPMKSAKYFRAILDCGGQELVKIAKDQASVWNEKE